MLLISFSLIPVVERPGIEQATSWSIVKYADPYTNEAVILVLLQFELSFMNVKLM